MTSKGRSGNKLDKPCWVYLIECKGGGIYVGAAQDVLIRYAKHCAGNGSLYTRLNRPVRLLAYREFPTRAEAMQEERRLKKLKFWEKLAWCRKLWRDGLENPFDVVDGRGSVMSATRANNVRYSS